MEKTIISPARKWQGFDFKELWLYRELLYFMVWRNLKVRYSQTFIGVLWVVVQPLATMLIFTILFGRFAKLPSEGFPYTIFVYSALLPWNLFSSSVSGSGTSIVMNRNLVTKVYFPRIIIPMSRVIENAIDFCVSLVIFFALMLFYRIIPSSSIFFLPVFLLWIIFLALGVGLWLASLDVKYRDFNYVVPFLVQIWLYVSPVAYSLSLIPKKWHLLYSLNPMVGIIEGFRWALLGKNLDSAMVIVVSFVMTCIIFIIGVVHFCNTEKLFADII